MNFRDWFLQPLIPPLKLIFHQLEHIMSNITDVQNAFSDLATSLNDDFTSISNAVAAMPGASGPAFQNVVDAIAAAKLNAANLTAAIDLSLSALPPPGPNLPAGPSAATLPGLTGTGNPNTSNPPTTSYPIPGPVPAPYPAAARPLVSPATKA